MFVMYVWKSSFYPSLTVFKFSQKQLFFFFLFIFTVFSKIPCVLQAVKEST